MAIDTTPSTVATNALQAIPFGALIGGPLDACIQAQAVAAKTSWEFIKQVGLTIDPETNETKAISVTFEYNNNGQMTTLVVPLIILLPIPYMAIDTVTIDFMANISAASSSVTETSEDSELGVAVDATAALQVGPFSLNVTAKANYSAKSHSKAAQDSRYSVEYTMQVHVAGGQADMPAGLQTVLNILQGSVTSVSSTDLVSIYPPSIPFNQSETGSVQISIKNNRGVNVEGSKVAIAFDSSSLGEDPFEAIEVSRGVSQVEMQGLLSDPRFNNSTIRAHRRLYAIPVQGVGMQASHQGNMIASTTAQSGELTQRQSIFGASTPTIGITDNKGQVSFSFKVKPKVMSGTRPVSGRLLVTADVPTVDAEGKPINPPSSETQYINFQIIPDGRQLDTTGLSANTTSVTFNTNTTKQTIDIVTLSLINSSDPIANCPVSVLVKSSADLATVFDDIKIGSTKYKPTSASGDSDSNGKISFEFTTKSSAPKCTGKMVFSTPNGEPIEVTFTVS